MAKRPILFRPELVRAILDGRKTVTRRPVKHDVEWIAGAGMDRDDPKNWGFADEYGAWCVLDQSQPPYPGRGNGHNGHEYRITSPYGCAGDRLWVRETWAQVPGCEEQGGVTYRADHDDPRGDGPANPIKWRPSIHMPRRACRLILEVTDVRVERLQTITPADVCAEGIPAPRDCDLVRAFADAWNEVYGGGAWDANPFVWRVAFKIAEVRR